MATPKKTAVVISGGGSKGAFAVGVLEYVFATYRHTGWFGITGGTSTGALIAPIAALMGAPDPTGSDALDVLIDMYTTVKTEDILDKQNFLELLVRRDALYESTPLNELLHEKFRPAWFEWLKRPEAPDCYVVYTNYQNGQKVMTSPKDPAMTRERFLMAVLASASVPVIMEATKIGGSVCYDGGVRDLLPFGRAIDLGAAKILPIFLDPEKFPETSGSFKNVYKIMLRTIEILVDETGRNDFEVAQLINFAIQAKERMIRAFEGDPEALGKLNQIFQEFEPLFGKRLIEIIPGLRPDKVLTEDSLTFDPGKMKEWVRLGFEKAKALIDHSPFE
jgi:predicted acylesterase/phospholipase RssA